MFVVATHVCGGSTLSSSVVLCVLSNFTIVMLRKILLFPLLKLCSYCCDVVFVLCLFLVVPRTGL